MQNGSGLDSGALFNPPALRTYRVVEILDRTFRIYRSNFIPFIGLGALVIIPLAILNVAALQAYNEDYVSSGAYFRGGYPASIWIVLAVSLFGIFIRTIFINGTITYITAENHLGRYPTLTQGLSGIRPRFGTLAAGIFLLGSVAAGSSFLFAVMGGMCYVPFVVLPLIGYLSLAAFFYLIPVLALERVTSGFGMRRSLWLGKMRFWPTLRLFFFVMLMLWFAGFLLGLLQNILPSPSTYLPTVDTVQVALETFIGILTAPVLPIALTLMYFDTRVRLEGLDIALQSTEAAEPRVSGVISPRPTGRFIRGADIGNTILLTVGAVAIVFLLSAAASTFLFYLL